MVFRLAHLPVSKVQSGVLFLTVLFIYGFDHWQDSLKIKTKITSRHQFFEEYQPLIPVFLLLLFLLIVVISVAFIPRSVFIFGVVTAFLSGIYLWLVKITGEKKWLIFQKELWVAIIFTTAIWGSVWARMQLIPFFHVLTAIIFSLTAFQNLLLFSYFEYSEDEMQHERSLVRSLGMKNSRFLYGALLGLVLFFSAWGWQLSASLFEKCVILIELVMSGILTCLFYRKKWAMQQLRYRYMGDAVFLLPVFAFFV